MLYEIRIKVRYVVLVIIRVYIFSFVLIDLIYAILDLREDECTLNGYSA